MFRIIHNVQKLHGKTKNYTKNYLVSLVLCRFSQTQVLYEINPYQQSSTI